MAIIKTAVSISIFNILCCIAFIIFKTLVFYEIIELRHKTYKVYWIFSYRPRAFYEFGYGMIFEMTGYLFGIFANSLLVMGINTARYKNNFTFFRIYYVASIWLSTATIIQGIQLELFFFIMYAGLNLIFLYVVVTIDMRIRKERSQNFQFDVLQ